MAAENFIHRHLGPREWDVDEMLKELKLESLDELIEKIIPQSIRLSSPLDLPKGVNEYDYFKSIKKLASKNKVFKSYIGTGYYHTVFPAAIQRNILENPSWYTSYTPYQAEISQGRLEALLNFQTAITELTGFDLANASLLDEATAIAEAMIMFYNARSRKVVKEGHNEFFIDENIFPQSLAVLETRAEPLNIKLIKGSFKDFVPTEKLFGALVQYPTGDGEVIDYEEFISKIHAQGSKVVLAADCLSLVLLKSPAQLGADVAVGSTQRLGIPMGFGGPHAAYFATKEEFKRFIPGRIIGVSKDKNGKNALRMALQTREQHIKRERATSNICTAQALLATMAGMYTIYHGPEGLKRIALHCHQAAGTLCNKLLELGFINVYTNYFDTLRIRLTQGVTQKDIKIHALEREINLRYFENGDIGISVDETTSEADVNKLLEVFAATKKKSFSNVQAFENRIWLHDESLLRKDVYMQQPIFNKYRSETELMRYAKKLEKRDISLTHSMISLGSCTMKLNAAIEMLPMSWPEFGEIHPFAPIDQTEGYQQLFHELGKMLKKITGFEAVSFQPNSGAAGEYAGLLVIRKFHEANNESHRNIMLIPSSAHGTNPASAVMAGMKVVVVSCDEYGNIDTNDLKAKSEAHGDNLAGIMITYPSTHGVFEPDIKDMIDIVHNYGGQVYMDGANMNAQVGLTSPAEIGADVCHLNLHKTFAIPHGGGGPGMGPICVAEHLVEHLPSHPLVETGGVKGVQAVSAAPYGSASILTISHAYCQLLGADGLTLSTKLAILNANYLAEKLKGYFKILYTGTTGYVAHEMILDCRSFKQEAGVTETDIAKRLIDYGFHAPTVSFPVHGTLMVEPTESESKDELDRFIESLISIYNEIMTVAKSGNEDNPLINAPHTQDEVTDDVWKHSYTRKEAAFPLDWIRENKFWPAVARIDDAFGDRNLMCTCPSVDSFKEE